MEIRKKPFVEFSDLATLKNISEVLPTWKDVERLVEAAESVTFASQKQLTDVCPAIQRLEDALDAFRIEVKVAKAAEGQQ